MDNNVPVEKFSLGAWQGLQGLKPAQVNRKFLKALFL